MNKYKQIITMLTIKRRILYFFSAAILLSSCTSTKKLIYLQGADSYSNDPQTIVQNYELKIQPDDQLYIIVSSEDQELLEPFGNNKLLGSVNQSSNVAEASGFRVGKNGKVQIPLLGEMQASGLTRHQFADKVKDELIRGQFIKRPTVTVQIKGFKISVMGEVKDPGVKEISGERITLLEALSLAGDLTPAAKRENIMILRETGNERVISTVDLTSASDVLNSPYYYLQQNDVIYVEPNGSIKVKGSPSLSYIGVGGSIISVVASLVSLIVVLSR